MAVDLALQYHLSTVENLILQNTSSISHILIERQGRHDSHVQKSYQGRHLWLGRRQTNLCRVDDLLLNWQCFASTLISPQCSSSKTMANYFFVMLSQREAVLFWSRSLMEESNWLKTFSLARFADELAFSLRTCYKTICGHVHKYEAAFGCGVDILMALTFLSIVLFQKQNQKMM